MEATSERIRKNGWRQGLILRTASLSGFLADDLKISESDHLMVVSQSCDLINRDLVREPYAVFLVLKSISTPVPGSMHGKNPRVIHFADGDGQFFEAWAWQQIFVPRERLAECIVANVSAPDIPIQRIVLDWLAKRFTRIAFPDDFNNAVKPEEKAVQKLLKKSHHLFTEILLGLEPFRELTEGERYEVVCYLVTSPENDDAPEKFNEASLVAAKLEEILKRCGLEIVHCGPVSESVITLAEVKELMRWDYDYLTSREVSP